MQVSKPVYIIAKTKLKDMPTGVYEIVRYTTRRTIKLYGLQSQVEHEITGECLQAMLTSGRWDITHELAGS